VIFTIVAVLCFSLFGEDGKRDCGLSERREGLIWNKGNEQPRLPGQDVEPLKSDEYLYPSLKLMASTAR
jgi:hypothetical protein